jgi:Xaa-Pro dipeptidase
MITSIRISDAEHRARCKRLAEHLAAEGLSGAVLFDSYYILYYTGFAFTATERPMAFILNSAGETVLFVPRLELEHAQANAVVGRVAFYPEYPADPHPMETLRGLLVEMAIAAHSAAQSAAYGADMDGYPWMLGYRGPSLRELMGSPPTRLIPFIEGQMAVKTAAEVALIREAVRWGNLAMTLLQRYTRVGATENEVSLRATAEATLALFDAIGPIYRPQSPIYTGPSANYRGQIGRNAAIPHTLANNITFRAGDVLGGSGDCAAWGYNAELERTMILGPASDEQRRMFEHMLALQDTALAALRPGVRCCDVDRATRGYYQAHDLMDYWKHHTGHGIGLRFHEGPFLDIADTTEIRPGMLFTIEPGLYIAGMGGFRHSDTVLVTADGNEVLTYYPRDLDSLTLPA